MNNLMTLFFSSPEISVSPDETKRQEIYRSANSFLTDQEQSAANPEEFLLSHSNRMSSYSTFPDN